MSEAGISVGGLVSGIDTNSLIDGLSNLEYAKARRIEAQKQAVTKTQSTFSELVTRLGTFSSKAGSLMDFSDFNQFKSSSNYDENATVSGDENATAGQYELNISKLATSQKVASKSFSSIINPLGQAGTIEIGVTKAALKADPSKKTTSVTITATDSLKDIVRKINAADAVGVSASLLALSNGENRLVLTAKDSGSDPAQLKDVTGSIFSSTLGITSAQQVARGSFSLLKSAGGAAAETDTLDLLSTGIGKNNLSDGDLIRLTGTDSNNNPITSDLAINISGPTKTTVKDILDQIDTAFSGAAKASLNSNGEIEVRDLVSGATTMSFKLELVDSDTSGSTLSLGESKSVNSFQNVINEATNAFFSIDGMAATSKSNAADGIVRGTTFNLKKAESDKTIKVGLALDTDGLVSKVKSFVDEYNAIIKFIDENSKVTVEKDATDRTSAGISKSTIKKGPFAGDGTIRKIKTDLQLLMTGSIDELASQTQFTSLSRIGVVTSANNDGTMMVKDDVLKKALTTDFDGVRRLFSANSYSDNPNFELGRYTKDTQTGTYDIDANSNKLDQNRRASINTATAASRVGEVLSSNGGDSKGLSVRTGLNTGSGKFTFVRGVASQIDQWYKQANDFVNGSFKQTREGFTRQVKELDKRVETMTDRADRYKDMLVRQFSGMEQNMSRLKSQSASFMAQIR